MDYEKKYKEALEKAKKELKVCGSMDCDAAKQIFRFFPELKESENERIKKEIIGYLDKRITFSNFGGDIAIFQRWIFWLQKQGDYNRLVEEMKERKELLSKEKEKAISTNDKLSLGGRIAILEELLAFTKEKQGEQKPTDKIEPKFKVGDWVVYEAEAWREVLQIETIDEHYTFTNGSSSSFAEEQNMRLWTIEDAKDGDVLVADDNEPFIFKGLLDTKHPNYPVAYCGLDSEDYFIVSRNNIWWADEYVKPATKEQRELLFQKIKEAGYEWDADKKELRKIEQKPAWSEKDEGELYLTISLLDEFKKEAYTNDCENCIQWLKSLKPQSRWKPTDEQIHCFKCVIDFYKIKVNDTIVLNLLNSLYNNLLKL